MSESDSSRRLPENLEVLYSREDIHAAMEPIAAEISAWAKEVHDTTGKQVLAACILRGGYMFFSELLQQLTTTVEPTFCRCSSYSSEANEEKHRSIEVTMFDAPWRDRTVLLIDDICDGGGTMLHVHSLVRQERARAVKSVVLVRRLRDDAIFQPDWSVFEYGGAEWLAGFGMEDKNHYMNYPNVYKILGSGG